jgi:hypothetical protein
MNAVELMFNYLDVFEDYNNVQAYAEVGFYIVTRGEAARLTLSDGVDNPLCRIGVQQELPEEWHC